jgi:hypothetical protein
VHVHEDHNAPQQVGQPHTLCQGGLVVQPQVLAVVRGRAAVRL